jgi:type I restriction enzyme S subunit
METELKVKLLINKANWTKVSFGDVAFEPKEISKDIYNDGIEHVVGLEHIDSENIHLSRSGILEETTTFSKKFKKGDVLFGRRRAYLKKAALASFSGICSGDITVFRAKKNLLPELLPFIVNNERFFDYAVKHSAGGLSPRVKFKDLANYEFLLPPIDQQVQLAELLWAMDEVIQRVNESFLKYATFYRIYLNDSVDCSNSKYSKDWTEYIFGKLGETYGGLNGKSKEDFGLGSPFITYMNVFSKSKIDKKIVDFVKIVPGEKQNEVKYGDILLTGSSETPEEVGMSSVVLDELSGYYLNSFCFGFRLYNFDILLPEYARFMMRGKEVREFMNIHAQGSTRFNLSKSIVKEKLKVILPSIEEQRLIISKLEVMEAQIDMFKSKITNSKALQKSLINQIFSE